MPTRGISPLSTNQPPAIDTHRATTGANRTLGTSYWGRVGTLRRTVHPPGSATEVQRQLLSVGGRQAIGRGPVAIAVEVDRAQGIGPSSFLLRSAPVVAPRVPAAVCRPVGCGCSNTARA